LKRRGIRDLNDGKRQVDLRNVGRRGAAVPLVERAVWGEGIYNRPNGEKGVERGLTELGQLMRTEGVRIPQGGFLSGVHHNGK